MVSRPTRLTPPVECVRLYDADAGLDGIIAIHSTALGPGAGGCCFSSYPDMNQALADALRFAEEMSYKNALAGLPFGGAKAVLRRPEGEFDRINLFRAFGQMVERLGGLYVTAKGVGTTVKDMREVAGATRHVAGLHSAEKSGSDNSSQWTAKSAFESMRAAARFVLDSDLTGLTVAVQGTGNVGADLCRRLADAGARLVIADPNRARRDLLAASRSARAIEVDDIAAVQAEIFVPCAIGGTLTPELVRRLKAKIVCGAANNQLASAGVADLLMNRGIAYIPDYIASAGGIISVSAEYLGEDESNVEYRVSRIAPRVTALLDRAAREKRSPALIADEMAEEIIACAKRVTV